MMNKVDLLVRDKMLTYPLLYPTRAAALFGIFADSGTNYIWKKGCIVATYPATKRFEGPIDLTDLDETDKRWNGDEDFARIIRIENELERRNRLYRAEHIDLYCTYGGRTDYGYTHLDNSHFDSLTAEYGGAVLFRAPFGKIDPDWAHAMERFISDLRVAFNRVYCLHFDIPTRDGGPVPDPSMYSRMPEAMKLRHANLKVIEEKLEAQTTSKAKSKKFMEEHGKALIASIKEEEDHA